MIRMHQITSGAVLDRRILEELFLEAAFRISQLGHLAFGDRVLSRTNIEVHALDDFEFNRGHAMEHRHKNHPAKIPNTNVEYRVQDSFAQYTVGWSLELEPTSNDCYFVMAWPVVNGEALWGLLDYRQAGQILHYGASEDPEVFPDPGDTSGGDVFTQEPLSMGTIGACDGLIGRGETCVMMAALGDWKVKKSSLRLGIKAR